MPNRPGQLSFWDNVEERWPVERGLPSESSALMKTRRRRRTMIIITVQGCSMCFSSQKSICSDSLYLHIFFLRPVAFVIILCAPLFFFFVLHVLRRANTNGGRHEVTGRGRPGLKKRRGVVRK